MLILSLHLSSESLRPSSAIFPKRDSTTRFVHSKTSRAPPFPSGYASAASFPLEAMAAEADSASMRQSRSETFLFFPIVPGFDKIDGTTIPFESNLATNTDASESLFKSVRKNIACAGEAIFASVTLGFGGFESFPKRDEKPISLPSLDNNVLSPFVATARVGSQISSTIAPMSFLFDSVSVTKVFFLLRSAAFPSLDGGGLRRCTILARGCVVRCPCSSKAPVIPPRSRHSVHKSTSSQTSQCHRMPSMDSSHMSHR